MLLFCPTCANILECEEVVWNLLPYLNAFFVLIWNMLLRRRAPVIGLLVLPVRTSTTSQNASQTGNCWYFWECVKSFDEIHQLIEQKKYLDQNYIEDKPNV